jgi:hypothetical protein
MARLAQSMGVGCLRQPIGLDLRRAYGPRLKQLDDALEMPAGEGQNLTIQYLTLSSSLSPPATQTP